MKNQLRLHYKLNCPSYRKMSTKEQSVFIDKALEFKNKQGYIPELWELIS